MWDLIQRLFALLLLIVISPALVLLFIVVKLESKGPFIFQQKRAGKGKKPFVMYKIRSMVLGAEALKKKYAHLNEANGPVFKISNDPRFTRIGKTLAYFAIDEAPQLINVIKGEMALVGPRPLPMSEAKRIPKKYQDRFKVLPGITSLWIVRGAHELAFEQWMGLDLDYVNQRNFFLDTKILLETFWLIGRGAVKRSS